MSESSETTIEKVRGDHCLNVFVSYELKDRLKSLAKKYDHGSGVCRAVPQTSQSENTQRDLDLLGRRWRGRPGAGLAAQLVVRGEKRA